MVAGARRQRHIGQRRVLARRRTHLRAIGHEQIGRVVRLAPLVQHRCSGIETHACAAHLVDRRAAGARMVEPHNDLPACFRQHFGGIRFGLSEGSILLGAEGEVDAQLRDAMSIDLGTVERQAVGGTRYAIRETDEHHPPRARGAQLCLIICADPGFALARSPPRLQRAALERESARVSGAIHRVHVPIAWNDDTGRAVAEGRPLLKTRHHRDRRQGVGVVHDVRAQHAARVRKAVRHGFAARIQQQLH
jgi:hypothetical protein